MTEKTLTENEFEFRQHRADEKLVVASHQVPNNRIYAIQGGEPIEIIVTGSRLDTISANSTETLTFDHAGIVQFMPSVNSESDIREDADLVVREEATETLAPNSSDIDVTNVTKDGSKYDSIDVTNNTGSDIEVETFYVLTSGQTGLQKRTAGTGNAVETLQKESTLRLTYSDPYDPDSDKQVTFDALGQYERLIPEKFKFEIEFYDDTEVADLQNATNVRIQLTVKSRHINDFADEVSSSELKQQIKRRMG